MVVRVDMMGTLLTPQLYFNINVRIALMGISLNAVWIPIILHPQLLAMELIKVLCFPHLWNRARSSCLPHRAARGSTVQCYTTLSGLFRYFVKPVIEPRGLMPRPHFLLFIVASESSLTPPLFKVMAPFEILTYGPPFQKHTHTHTQFSIDVKGS